MRAVFLLLLVACSGCGPASKPPTVTPPRPDAAAAPAPRTGKILFYCEPSRATVTVDGTPRGTAAESAAQGGLVLPQGLHRLEVSLEGYRTYRLELNLGDRLERIEIKLQPVGKGL